MLIIYSGTTTEEMLETTSKFAEERMKLYEESLTNSNTALATTKPPIPDIKTHKLILLLFCA